MSLEQVFLYLGYSNKYLDVPLSTFRGLSVCFSEPRTAQKRLNYSRCCLEHGLGWTQVTVVTGVPPGEYGGSIFAAAAMRLYAIITVATSCCCHCYSFCHKQFLFSPTVTCHNTLLL